MALVLDLDDVEQRLDAGDSMNVIAADLGVTPRRNPTRIFDLDDLTMLVGAATDGQLLEIGVADTEGIEFIVHAMAARDKFLR